MTGSVASIPPRIRIRANVPPSGNALNKLNIALEEMLLSESVPVSGTSIDSAALASASAPMDSAVASESAASASASSIPVASAVSSVPSSAAPRSASSALASTVSTSASASQIITPTSAAGGLSSASATPATRSVSPSEPVLSIPKNVAVSATESSADAVSTAAPKATVSSASLESKAATSSTSSGSLSSSPARPASTSASSTSAPGTTQAPVPSLASSSSTSFVVSTQNAQTSTAPDVSTHSSTAVPQTSAIARPNTHSSTTLPETSAIAHPNSNTVQQQPTSAGATSPLSSDRSPVSGAQVQNSPASANSGVTQSPTVLATDRLGNSLLGDPSSSSVHVDSTLRTPVAVTITSGSSTFTTTPAFVTSVSVSSGTDGSAPQTFTSIFANPTSASKSAASSGWSFWDTKGVIAGVFTGVVLVILTLVGFGFICYRRRRRRLAHETWASNHFRRFSGPPDMSQPTTYQPVRGISPLSPTYRDDPQRHLMAPSLRSGASNGHDDSALTRPASSQVSHHSGNMQGGALGLTGLLANSSGNMQQSYNGPFSDCYRYTPTGDSRLSTSPANPVGVAVSSDFDPKNKRVQDAEPTSERRTPSPAPSTPSIYPPSLPPVPEKDEDAYLFYEREIKRRPEPTSVPAVPQKAVINDADSRNPFESPLDVVYDAAHRQSAPTPRVLTNQAYRPLTPPDSISSHSPTSPQFAEMSEATKPLNTSPFSNSFLGRSVSIRTDPLPRPKRNPLRLSASSVSVNDKETS